MYGNLWVQRWEGFPLDVVKADWHDELRFYELDTIKRALDYCRANQTLPPTLPEFSRMCREQKVRPEHRPMLPPPPKTPNNKALEEIAKLSNSLGRDRPRDPLDCFRRILKEHAEGTYTNHYGLKMAREALGVTVER